MSPSIMPTVRPRTARDVQEFLQARDTPKTIDPAIKCSEAILEGFPDIRNRNLSISIVSKITSQLAPRDARLNDFSIWQHHGEKQVFDWPISRICKANEPMRKRLLAKFRVPNTAKLQMVKRSNSLQSWSPPLW